MASRSGQIAGRCVVLCALVVVWIASSSFASAAEAVENREPIEGLSSSRSSAEKHRFSPGNRVPFAVHNIGPYANPSETYDFYSIPFCSPSDVQKERPDLGDALGGELKESALYDIRFLQNVDKQSLCKVSYTESDVAELRKAVLKNYYFKLDIDDMPLWGFLGIVDAAASSASAEEAVYLYPHLHFKIGVYKNQYVTEVNVSTPSQYRVRLEKSKPLSFAYSYSVTWFESDVPFSERMEAYKRNPFFARAVEIQWFYILFSLMLVSLLVFLVFIIISRILKRDVERYANAHPDEGMLESGWKLLHADVFRVPHEPFRRSILSSLIGTGVQLMALAVVLFTLGLFDVFDHTNRGKLYATMLFVYALTSGIAGHVSTRFYIGLGGERWVHNCIFTVVLFPLPVFVVWAFLNSVALTYESMAALPFLSILKIFLLWGFVTFPLTILGAVTGKRRAQPFEFPCKSRTVAREVPRGPWTTNPIVTTAIAGFVSFSSIYVEIYYLFVSLWGRQLYTPYSIMLITFALLVLVTSCVTVAITYHHLALEDHRWWIRSVLTGGSAAFVLFAYCFFFLPEQSDMQGFLQVSFYFGYMFLICYAFFIILGTVGFLSSFFFVTKIYRAVKFD
eukprot:ANDGO_05332.mRNA.1 Transmembrane 9 superfamily member 4